MRRIVFSMLLALSVLLCACDGAANPGYSDVTLELDVSKALSATQMDVVAYYRYDAEILGDSVSDQGEVSDAVLLVNGGTASLGRLAQGRWRFTVRAYNPRGLLLYTGSQEMYVGSASFTARIVLSQPSETDGTLTVDITALKFRAEPASLVAVWKALDGSSSESSATWTVTDGYPDSEHVRYTGQAVIREGRYSLTLSLYGSEQIASSVVDMMIVGGDTTSVTGTLNPSADQSLSLQVTGPGDLRGHIEPSGTAAAGSAVTYRWINEGDPVASYIWTVNGAVQSSTSYTMSYTAPAEGVYTVSCIVKNASGESGCALVEMDMSSGGWQSLGTCLLADYGSSKGSYSVSYDGTMVERLSGTGGRYLGFTGYYRGDGSAASPHVIWAPYIGGSNSTAAIGTSLTDGRASSALLLVKDKTQAPHALGGSQVVSAGGALARLGDTSCHIPSKSEMEYVRSALASGALTLPDGLYWTSSEQGTQAWALSVSSNTGTLTLVSKTATGGVVYVRLV